MRTEKKLLPGAPGTKKLLRRYGNQLICVRYRYDAEHDMTVKTVELIVEKRPRQRKSRQIPKDTLMCLRVEYGEVEVGKRIREAGGTWNRSERVWRLAYKDVMRLGLTDRIVPDPSQNAAGKNT